MTLDESSVAMARWCDPASGIMACIAQEIEARGVHPARTAVLVPYAQLIGVARAMWARCAPPGFTPCFETPRSWARSAGGFVPVGDDIAFDMGRDLVVAQSLLARAGLKGAQATLAPRLVQTALQLAPLAAAQMPAERPAWSARLRTVLGAGDGSEWFGIESALHAIALAWVTASNYASDGLLEGGARRLADALILLEGWQPDPLAQRLATLFDAPLRLPLADVSAAPSAAIHVHEAQDPEDEAERAAACVLRHLAAGRTPLALVVTDRALTRRVSAQLWAHGVATQDETGWKLSTTRAAATLMSALRAGARDASSDQVLDWLKGAPGFDAAQIEALERRLRDRGLRDWAAWCAHAAALQDSPSGVFTQHVETLRASLTAARPLAHWRKATRELLQAGAQWAPLIADAAGARVIQALALDGEQGRDEGPRWTLAEFNAWVREVLESVSVVLAPPEGVSPCVTVLPLQQLPGRAFAAVVLPGCDERHLPASPEPPGDWSGAQRTALGLPTRTALAAAQRSLWRCVLQAPHCDLLWRRFDAGGEPVRPSSLLQLLQLDGLAQAASDPREVVRRAVQPVAPPQPRAASLPVHRLSASAYADLRRCPYRFFALRQLGLRTAEELDVDVDKRDFGNWLHTVLADFHQTLQATPTGDANERLHLIDAAQARATKSLGLSHAEFLPFAAAWPAVRDGYLAWLARHEEKEGAHFVESEAERTLPLGPRELELTLIGRLDRIDRTPDGHAFMIDYKTESLQTTRERVKEPCEDTQLAFYAALLEDDHLRAAYVNVGENESGTNTVEQFQVVAARDALVHGILDDLGRIAAGAMLPALGEGQACERCDARGLCRKDFWTVADEESP